MTMISNSIATI